MALAILYLKYIIHLTSIASMFSHVVLTWIGFHYCNTSAQLTDRTCPTLG